MSFFAIPSAFLLFHSYSHGLTPNTASGMHVSLVRAQQGEPEDLHESVSPFLFPYEFLKLEPM